MRPVRPVLLALLALGLSVLPYGCAAPGGDASHDFTAFRRYGASDGQLVQGTLAIQSTQEKTKLSGVTQLVDGTCLAEIATLDATGRLVHGEAHIAGPGGEAHAVLEPTRGSVDLTAPSLHTRWSVPADLPWIWNPLLEHGASGARVATPLSAVVALRAASIGQAVRELDLRELHSHTLMNDQLVVPNEDSYTVVLGDDAVEVDHGLPRRIHLAAFGRELETIDAPEASSTSPAAFSCRAVDGLRNS